MEIKVFSSVNTEFWIGDFCIRESNDQGVYRMKNALAESNYAGVVQKAAHVTEADLPDVDQITTEPANDPEEVQELANALQLHFNQSTQLLSQVKERLNQKLVNDTNAGQQSQS